MKCVADNILTHCRGSAVSVLDGLRHPNLLGLADPVLYLDEENGGEGEVGNGGVLKIVTESGDELPAADVDGEGQPQSQAEREPVRNMDGRVEDARELFLQLARGLHCLHANLYLHRFESRR